MPDVTISDDNYRYHDMGDSDGTTNVSSIGGGAGAGVEPDFYLQGSNSVSRKVGTTQAGFQVYNASASPVPDFSGNDKLWMAKLLITNKDALTQFNTIGAELRYGSDTSNYWMLDIYCAATYPLKGGWVIFPIAAGDLFRQPTSGTERTGTPSDSSVLYYGITAQFVRSSKSENVILDAIDIGSGLSLTGGVSPVGVGSFEDFIEYDEGQATAGRFGYFTTIEGGVIVCFGRHWIGNIFDGTPIPTIFDDSNKTIVFPESAGQTDFTSINFDITDALTEVNLNQITMLGPYAGWKYAFNTETEIDSTSDEIQTAELLSETSLGTYFTIFSESGTESIGVSSGTAFWAAVSVTTPTGISGHSNRRLAMRDGGSGGATPFNLTASSSGNGEIWYLSRNSLDLRPVLSVIADVAGSPLDCGSFAMTGCSIQNFRRLELSKNCSLNNNVFIGLSRVTFLIADSSTVLDGNSFSVSAPYHTSTPWTPEEAALINLDFTAAALFLGQIPVIQNNVFDNSEYYGHRQPAIRLQSTATLPSPASFTLFNNDFISFGPNPEDFDAFADVDGSPSTITIAGHPYFAGDPVIYNNRGGTSITGLTSGKQYFVGIIDVDTITLHLNKGDALNGNAPINIAPLATSPQQIHQLGSLDAAIMNATGTHIEIVSTGSTDAPTYCNADGASSTTIVKQTLITLTGLKENTEVRVFTAGSPIVELAGIENIASPTEFAFSAVPGIEVDIRIFAINYEPADLEGYVIPTADTVVPIQQRFDRNYQNP